MRASPRIAGLALVAACGPAAAGPDPTPPAPATPAACERLAEHLVRLVESDLRASGLETAGAQAQRPELLRRCLAHGDALTADCLLAARSLEETARCRALDPSREPEPLADGERATPEQCARFAAHAVELMRTDLERGGLEPAAADEAAGALEATCLAEASRRQVECGLGARTVPELEGC